MFRRFTILTLCILNALVFATTVDAQDDKKSKPKNVWLGTLDVGVAKLRLKIDVTETNGTKSAVMYSLDQGNAKMPLDYFTEKDGTVKFALKKATIVFEGKLNKKKNAIEGTFTQGGQPFKISFHNANDFKADKHVETWQGTMDAGTRKFEFQIRVFKTQNGRTAKLDSFSENLLGLPLELSEKDNQFSFEFRASGAKFEGKYSDDKQQIVGKWTQRGNELDLTFKKIALSQTRDPKAKRPQTPKGPFPYKSELVKFENKKDSVTLAGTLTIPKGTGPFPAVILISGSGPQDRDETIFDHRAFWVIADRMTRAGIAVLRYDERGIGKSTGNYSKANSLDLSRDAEAGIEFLKSRGDIDKNKIGIIGHSEGGYIGPMIAARNKSVAFLVCMAGPGVPGKEIIKSQSRLIAEAMGESKKEVDYAIDLSMKLIEVVEANKSANQKTLIKKMEQRMDQYVAENKPSKKFEESIGTQKAGIARLASPWFRFFLTHDPRVDLRKVTVPVFVFCGSKDLQVDADLNLPEIEKALKEAGNRNITIMKVDGLNHLFQKTKTGRVDEYASLEETFNEDMLKKMVEWVVKTTK